MDSGDLTAAARRAGDHPLLVAGARLGYAVNGLLHLLLAWLGVQLALGFRTTTVDQSGAFTTIAGTGVGKVLLGLGLTGFGLLGLWQGIEAVIGRGAAARVKAAAKALVYLGLAWSAYGFLSGAGSDSTTASVDFTTTVMAQPLGRWLVALVGVGVVAVGGYHVAKGVRRTFLRDLAEHPGTWVVAAGRCGYVAKGVALAVVGCLFLLAAQRANAAEATGLDGALRSLAGLPEGTVLLLVVAFGFAGYAVYSLARSRYARV